MTRERFEKAEKIIDELKETKNLLKHSNNITD